MIDCGFIFNFLDWIGVVIVVFIFNFLDWIGACKREQIRVHMYVDEQA